MKKAICLAAAAAMVLSCSVQAFAVAGYGNDTTATQVQAYIPTTDTGETTTTTTTTSTVQPGTLSTAAITSAVNNKDAEGVVSLSNVAVVTAASMKDLAAKAGEDASLSFTQTEGGKAIGGIVIPAAVAATVNTNIKPTISLDAAKTQKSTNDVKATFGKDVTVASLGSEAKLSGDITIMLDFGTATMPANPYAYVRNGNKLFQVQVQVEGGKVVVVGSYLGDVIISDGPLG